ncbi:MAG: RecX family transcriptional regulator, partial [Alphaproteobacteria bacterium]|nr:RecX family transcriptional regulator [Alphaproteobacteria bacterium]
MGNETEPRGRKIPKPVTAQRLQARALAYLSRYASSSENLRRVLERAVRRAACHHETDRAAAAETITGLIAKFERAGILDDNAYAEARVRSLHRGGASRAKIAAQMA